jgi:hypothetical protein
MNGPVGDRIRRLAKAVQHNLDQLYDSSAPPAPESPLNQAGLRDGLQVVDEFLRHNEIGCAFDHLLYMLVEPDLALTQSQFEEMRAIGRQLGLQPHRWQRVRATH